jgi:hypothetical protein
VDDELQSLSRLRLVVPCAVHCSRCVVVSLQQCACAAVAVLCRLRLCEERTHALVTDVRKAGWPVVTAMHR